MFWAIGNVKHKRTEPRLNYFSYPVSYVLLDLDNLSDFTKQTPFFSLDRFNYLSIYQRDYSSWGTESIKSKISKILQKEKAEFNLGKVFLLTMPKVFGYIFIPVSFYLCYNKDQNFSYLIAEINNTFYEKHIYVLDVNSAKLVDGYYTWNFGKDFHVSPFYGLDYDYEVKLKIEKDDISIYFDLIKGDQKTFYSSVDFKLQEHQQISVFNKYFYFPFLMVMAMPLIIWQALKLSLIRRLTVFKKPNPNSKNTIRASMYSWFDMLCFKLVYKRLSKISGGRIKLIYPDNREEIIGKEGEILNFKLNNFEVFRKLILKGSVGFGESYVNKDWDSDRLADFLKLMLDNYSVLAEDKLNKLKLFRYIEDIKHWLRKNTIFNSKKNIREHYDLSNDFFKLFLDSNLLYSSAYFKHKSQSLEEAQIEKLDLLIDKAKIQNGHKVLEIGSGWGACANRMALNHNCQVTSITLSEEQLQEARSRAQALGISKQVNFEIKDYRELSEKYDRILSIEMLEAVGADNLNTYFKKCEEALNPNGILAVQVIAYPDTHYKSYLGKSDWINRHIFPGSHLPSLGALLEAAARNNLVIENVENIAEHYALTLKLWLERFDQKIENVKELGFSESFIRKWRFYLAVCEAEFASRWISVYQIVFTRPNSKLESKENVYKLYKVA